MVYKALNEYDLNVVGFFRTELTLTEDELVVLEQLIVTIAARTLQELVAAAASLHSDRAAVKYDGSMLLYRDLVRLSGELARVLGNNCAPNSGVIRLYCSDDLCIPVWILGILQSPAAYVPLDPEAPGLLTARVMNQCGLKYCAVKTDVLRLISHESDDLAYVLHTSGTTGLPKIVRVPHKCILPNILHLRSLFQMSADDVVLLASPLTFDPSVVDMFLALSSSAQLLVIPTVIKKTPGRLSRLLFRDNKTTVLQVTPTLLGRFGRRVLRQEALSPGSSLRVLALGGEACPSPALLSSWRHEDNRTHIYNVYGITEVSCWACSYKIPESLLRAGHISPSSVPLGTPLMDTTVEVRDEHGRVVTEGEGQVFIGGEDRVCLLDDEEAAAPGTMRASGDWVDVKEEQMFYLGRRDRLVKRHGKRVNLESVQQLICSLPQVEACAVGLHGGFRLLAFVVASTSGDQDQRAAPPLTQERTSRPPRSTAGRGMDGDLSQLVLNRLSLLLPSHNVPDTLVLVPALCLTPHGERHCDAPFILT
ncbi:LOW QUALITY PROTEIN: beta-alanine-activating enzyme-like [Lycodopsis pacificus]